MIRFQAERFIPATQDHVRSHIYNPTSLVFWHSVGTHALAPLTIAAADPHADVRKAAVIGLSAWAHQPTAERALRTALEDPDADVRANARHGLAAVPAG